MKSRSIVLASFLLAFAVPAAHAAVPAHLLGGSAGLVSPTGDFGDAVGTGWFLGASYQYRFHAQWAAGVDLDYFAFGEKSESFAAPGGARTIEQSAHGGQSQFYAMWYVPMRDDRFEPYVKGGYFHHRIGVKTTVTHLGSSVSDTDREMKPGFGLGVGASMALDERTRVGIELLYCEIETSGEAADFLQVGLTCHYRIGK